MFFAWLRRIFGRKQNIESAVEIPRGVPHPNPSNDNFRVAGQHGEEVAHKCGHLGYTRYRLEWKGDPFWDNSGHQGPWQQDICPECWLASVKPDIIWCCTCGGFILPGDPIVLCHSDDPVPEGIDIAMNITTVQDAHGKPAAVHCCRCIGPMAIYIATHLWVGGEQKIEPLHESGLCGPAEALRTGQPVLIDLG